MEARVKATGKIVEIVGEGIQNSNMVMSAHGEQFTKDELDIVPLSWKPFEPTYWQKLEHQYAGMAMQGLMSYVEQITPKKGRSFCDEIVDISFKVAQALVEKYKKEEK